MNITSIFNNINKLKLNFPRIISYLLLYGLFGVFNFIYLRSYVLLIAIIIFILIPVFSLLQLLALSNAINIESFLSEETITVDDNLGFSINIINPSLFSSLKMECFIDFQNIYYNEKGSQTFVIPVTAKSKNNNPFYIKVNSSGIISVSMQKCKLYDILGLFNIEFTQPQSISAFVMPKPYTLSDIQQYGIITGFTDNEDETKTGNEYSDTSNIREYIPGDRIKDIHWKLSSKKNELLVREHIRSCENKLMLWVDYSNIKKENEKIIQIVFSICKYCLTEGILVSLLWNDTSNSLNNYPIENNEDIIKAITSLYSTIKHDNLTVPKDLLITASIKAESIIRVGRYNSEVNLYIYEI